MPTIDWSLQRLGCLVEGRKESESDAWIDNALHALGELPNAATASEPKREGSGFIVIGEREISEYNAEEICDRVMSKLSERESSVVLLFLPDIDCELFDGDASTAARPKCFAHEYLRTAESRGLGTLDRRVDHRLGIKDLKESCIGAWAEKLGASAPDKVRYSERLVVSYLIQDKENHQCEEKRALLRLQRRLFWLRVQGVNLTLTVASSVGSSGVRIENHVLDDPSSDAVKRLRLAESEYFIQSKSYLVYNDLHEHSRWLQRRTALGVVRENPRLGRCLSTSASASEWEEKGALGAYGRWTKVLETEFKESVHIGGDGWELSHISVPVALDIGEADTALRLRAALFALVASRSDVGSDALRRAVHEARLEVTGLLAKKATSLALRAQKEAHKNRTAIKDAFDLLAVGVRDASMQALTKLSDESPWLNSQLIELFGHGPFSAPAVLTSGGQEVARVFHVDAAHTYAGLQGRGDVHRQLQARAAILAAMPADALARMNVTAEHHPSLRLASAAYSLAAENPPLSFELIASSTYRMAKSGQGPTVGGLLFRLASELDLESKHVRLDELLKREELWNKDTHRLKKLAEFPFNALLKRIVAWQESLDLREGQNFALNHTVEESQLSIDLRPSKELRTHPFFSREGDGTGSTWDEWSELTRVCEANAVYCSRTRDGVHFKFNRSR